MNIEKMYLTPNKYSRPQTKLKQVRGVVVHYVGNANSTALANRNYFESNKDRQVYASSHYIIGLDGETIQCIPESEIAYCSNHRNSDTISIECCHPDWSGKFNDDTLNSLRLLLKDLMKRYDLTIESIIRHYDVTGKMCPIYYVKNPSEWDKLKESLLEESIVKLNDFLVNGSKIPLNSILYNEENYIRLRDFEKLGVKIGWNNKNKIASIDF